jgi:hypothetical protein
LLLQTNSSKKNWMHQKNDFIILVYTRIPFFVKQNFSPIRNQCNPSLYIMFFYCYLVYTSID